MSPGKGKPPRPRILTYSCRECYVTWRGEPVCWACGGTREVYGGSWLGVGWGATQEVRFEGTEKGPPAEF